MGVGAGYFRRWLRLMFIHGYCKTGVGNAARRDVTCYLATVEVHVPSDQLSGGEVTQRDWGGIMAEEAREVERGRGWGYGTSAL